MCFKWAIKTSYTPQPAPRFITNKSVNLISSHDLNHHEFQKGRNESLTVFPPQCNNSEDYQQCMSFDLQHPFRQLKLLVTEKFRPVDTCLREEVRRPFILNLTANIAFRNQFLACTCAFQTDPITDKKEQSKMSRTLQIELTTPPFSDFFKSKNTHWIFFI